MLTCSRTCTPAILAITEVRAEPVDVSALYRPVYQARQYGGTFSDRETHPDYSRSFIAGALTQVLTHWFQRGYDLPAGTQIRLTRQPKGLVCRLFYLKGSHSFVHFYKFAHLQ